MRATDFFPPIATRFVRRLFNRSVLLKESKDTLDILARLPPSTAATVKIEGRCFRVDDGKVFAHMYRTFFGKQICKFLCNRPDPYVIDCGANVGITVLYWKSLYPKSRVTALEPDPTIFSMLRDNCDGIDGIRVIEAAVWTDNGYVEFNSQNGVGGHLNLISKTTERGRRISVKAVRLRDFLNKRIDLLKMDIEGAEVDVLIDCADRLSFVDRLYVEYHAFIDQPQRIGQFFQVLENANFIVHAHAEMPAVQPFLERTAINGKHHRLNVFASKVGMPEVSFTKIPLM